MRDYLIIFNILLKFNEKDSTFPANMPAIWDAHWGTVNQKTGINRSKLIAPQQSLIAPQQSLIAPQQPLIAPQQPLITPQQPLIAPQHIAHCSSTPRSPLPVLVPTLFTFYRTSRGTRRMGRSIGGS
jgi:hypothetical protein